MRRMSRAFRSEGRVGRTLHEMSQVWSGDHDRRVGAFVDRSEQFNGVAAAK
jgi:hypothetical protein